MFELADLVNIVSLVLAQLWEDSDMSKGTRARAPAHVAPPPLTTCSHPALKSCSPNVAEPPASDELAEKKTGWTFAALAPSTSSHPHPTITLTLPFTTTTTLSTPHPYPQYGCQGEEGGK